MKFQTKLTKMIKFVTNIFNVPQIYAKVQQAVWIFIENISKTAFSFFIATQKEMHKSRKAQRKNLVALY